MLSWLKGLFRKPVVSVVDFDSGKALATLIRLHRLPFPENWREPVAQIALESQLAAIRTVIREELDRRGYRGYRDS